MDENMNYQNEAEETAEEVEAVETAEEIEETEECTECGCAECACEPVLEEPAKIKKGSKAGAIIAVVVAAVVIAAAIITQNDGLYGLFSTNKYNKMGYVDISGKTVQDILDEQGMELSEFLESYDLPEDMPSNTYESVAYYMIPVKRIAEMYGMDFATMKSVLPFPDSVTEDTPWGEAEGEITVGAYIGEDNLDTFRETYGLPETVTAETKWKEIRNTVDEVQKKQREEAAAQDVDADTDAEEEETEE